MLLSFVKQFNCHDQMVESFVFIEKGNKPRCMMTMNDIESGNRKINDCYLFVEIDKYAIRFRSCRNMKIACNLNFSQLLISGNALLSFQAIMLAFCCIFFANK